MRGTSGVDLLVGYTGDDGGPLLSGYVTEAEWYEAHGIGKRDLKIKNYLDD